MIQWNCNFQIEDSTIQVDVAYVKIINYVNIDDTAEVTIQITDYSGDVIIKEYLKKYSRTFENTKEVYKELVKDFLDAVILA